MKKNILFGILILLIFSIPLKLYAFKPLGKPDRTLIQYPDDEDAPTPAIVELGKKLFNDTRLSVNDKTSCATCHNSLTGFGEGVFPGFGTMGNQLERKSPTLYNVAFMKVFMWDGRFETLEDQAKGPIQAAEEMNMKLSELIPKLQKIKYYKRQFDLIYGDEGGLTEDNLVKAIAAYERSIIVDDTPFDRYIEGDISALSPSAIRGLELFENKAGCAKCHDGPNLTNNGFHNIGITNNQDKGRFNYTKRNGDIGRFKTPGLRNILLRAPYFHNGSAGSLQEVIEHYNRGGGNNSIGDKDSLMKELHLTPKEIRDLTVFLGSLTQTSFDKTPLP